VLFAVTRAQGFLVWAAVSLGAWFALLELLALLSRPNKPEAGPASMIDVGEDGEPPAVVNYIANGCMVTDAGVAATLLDLAAHRYLTVDEQGPDQFVCRLREGGSPVRPYEQSVLGHVRSLAVNGVVPCQALTTGTEGESEAWRKGFDKAVAADARSRGLTKGRWTKAAIAILGAAAVVPAGFLVAAIAATPPPAHPTRGHSHTGVGDDLVIGLVAWGILMAAVTLYRSQRPTAAGRSVWARWLGLREYLHRDENFAIAPPAAVAIWDRYLAYGVALGVAPAAARALPFGAESDRAAWSSYGGRWRLVQVRYPHAPVRPGWGWNPAKAILLVLWLAVPVFVLVRVAHTVSTHHIAALTPSRWSGNVRTGVTVGVSLLVVAAAYGVVTWLRVVAGGVADVFFRTTVAGQIIRTRRFGDRCYVAVDDGKDEHVLAWNVRPAVYQGRHEGELVQARIGRCHQYVYRLEPDHRTSSAGPPSRSQGRSEVGGPSLGV
jgi:hypothetical protein